MANNYFDFIGQNAGEEKKETPQQTQAMENVTVRCDADCFLLCDGEYLDIQLEAGKMAKIQIPIGQHLLEFLYTEDPDIKIEKEVDFPDAGKSYLVIIKGLKDLVDGANAEAQAKVAEEEAKRIAAEEEARRKAEEEAKRKAETEARVKAEVEARFKAEEEARLKAKADADLKKAIAYFGLGNIDPTNTIFGDMTVAQKNSFDIVLKKAGALKGEVTKLIKAFAGLGLKEAKDLVDDTPSVIKRGVAKAEAEAFKKQLEEVGAEVELK